MNKTLVCAFLLISVAFAQLHVGEAWQGTWSDGKRSAGGSTYICVDPWTATAHGVYSGVGLFSGFLQGNTLTGFWYEAGYDRPFGPFELTISGNSFSGTWSYYQGEGLAPSDSFSWSGSKSSSAKPSRDLCLAPATGSDASGTYEPGNHLCYVPKVPYSNTNQDSAFGSFPGFANVGGYSPDNGITFLMSDFYFPNVTEAEIYRPENSLSTLGPCESCFDDDGEPPENEIPTRRIVVGRLVNSAEFCGYFWEGLYNKLIGGGGAICLQRTNNIRPDLALCGTGVNYVNAQIDKQVSDGITSWILSKVQSAFDALDLPPVVIIPNDFFTTDGNPNTGSNPTNSGGSNSATNSGGVTNIVSGADSSASTVVVSALFIVALVFTQI